MYKLIEEKDDFYIFSPEEKMRGLLDPNPTLYFSLLWGIKLLTENNTERNVSIGRTKDGIYYCNPKQKFSYEMEKSAGIVTISLNDKTLTIFPSHMDC